MQQITSQNCGNFLGDPTPQEFKNILDDYEIKIWLAAMDLDVSDVEELFHLLDDGGDAWMDGGWTFDGFNGSRSRGSIFVNQV